MTRISNTTMAFKIGFDHGRVTGEHVSRREVANWSPGWDEAEIEAYLNGRDDGVAGDTTRIAMMKAALAAQSDRPAAQRKKRAMHTLL